MRRSSRRTQPSEGTRPRGRRSGRAARRTVATCPTVAGGAYTRRARRPARDGAFARAHAAAHAGRRDARAASRRGGRDRAGDRRAPLRPRVRAGADDRGERDLQGAGGGAVPATARVEHALARLARSRKLRSPQVVAVGSSFLGIAAFWLTASLVEAFTDRDWTLSGMEWPADFVTAGLLVCLVPPVLLGVQLLLNAVARRRVEPAHLRAARAVRRSSSTDG